MDKLDLLHAERRLRVTGAFYLPDAFCEVTFDSVTGLSAFLDYYLNHGRDDRVGRMYLASPNNGRQVIVANLRFQFSYQEQVAAAVLLAVDKAGTQRSWVTADAAAHGAVELSHDSWNPENTHFPDTAYIHMAVLRHTLLEFGFGRVLPPRPATWQECDDPGWL